MIKGFKLIQDRPGETWMHESGVLRLHVNAEYRGYPPVMLSANDLGTIFIERDQVTKLDIDKLVEASKAATAKVKELVDLAQAHGLKSYHYP